MKNLNFQNYNSESCNKMIKINNFKLIVTKLKNLVDSIKKMN